MSLIEAPDVSSPGFKADPHPFYARLRAEAPVLRVRLAFWITAWLVTRYDDVAFVLRDERFSKDFTARMRWVAPPHLRVLNRHLLNADPPDHTRLRTLVSRAFTPRAVEMLRSRAQAVCDELLDAAAARGGLELVRELALPPTFRIARAEVEIAGVTVPRGGVVLAVIGTANRDEARFPQADLLDLGRDPNPHLAFGEGGRISASALRWPGWRGRSPSRRCSGVSPGCGRQRPSIRSAGDAASSFGGSNRSRSQRASSRPCSCGAPERDENGVSAVWASSTTRCGATSPTSSP